MPALSKMTGAPIPIPSPVAGPLSALIAQPNKRCIFQREYISLSFAILLLPLLGFSAPAIGKCSQEASGKRHNGSGKGPGSGS